METLLMTVTLVSLALAIGMAVLAWRLLREDRQRSAARAEALEAMAAESDEPVGAPRGTASPMEEGFVRQPSIEPRPRLSTGLSPRAPEPAPVRFAALDDDGRLGDWEFRRQQESSVPVTRLAASNGPQRHTATSSAEVMFGSAVDRPVSSRRWLAVAAVALLMACGIGAVYAISRPAVEASNPPSESTATRIGDARPLELLSLRHSTDPDGAFTVTGLVQNPYGGHAVHKVVAVVYLFDRDGNYFAGGKAALDFTALQPGDESPFVVHVPNVSRVSRYRVGFRSEDGGVVAHIDRRGQLPGSTTGDAIDGSTDHRSVSPVSAPRRSEGKP